ncbi:glycosyltransferase family 2 protein [Dactylosporangium sp. NPDC051541]|uniref:glycosyltransferase family 2 protein n=1 Tax=Dactylosporangium sp. NPDC051541 TaxID=3363977 RepID=UPI00378EC990
MSLTLQREQPVTTPPEAGYRPGAVVDIDVAAGIADIPAVDGQGVRRDRAWVLIRVFGEPLGHLELPISGDVLAAERIAAAADAAFGGLIRDRVEAAGGTLAGVPTEGVVVPQVPRHLAEREEALLGAPSIAVVVATRNRPATLARSLRALLGQQYPRFRVIVVDNAPTDDLTRACVAALADERLTYIMERRPGLSWARNCGIRAAGEDVVAFLDDDELPDEHWLAEIARGFWRHPQADVVTGVIVPAELDTYPQDLFERLGGHSKGRGFRPAVFSPETAAQQSPLYPLPPFGAGGNMAIRRSCFAGPEAFDVALGAGTPACGAEDTQMLTRILLAGGTIVYQPSALVWHSHHRTMAALETVMRGYGTGLTAYYTSLLLDRPGRIVQLARLVPSALRDLAGRDARSLGAGGDTVPRPLTAANRRGLLTGPYRYLRSRAKARALRKQV